MKTLLWGEQCWRFSLTGSQHPCVGKFTTAYDPSLGRFNLSSGLQGCVHTHTLFYIFIFTYKKKVENISEIKSALFSITLKDCTPQHG